MWAVRNEVTDFAARLQLFCQMFDGLFLEDEKAVGYLEATRDSLRDKANRNEGLLPVIIAMGESYDGAIDRAKADEAAAMLDLLAARRRLRDAVVSREKEKEKKAQIRALFGIE